MTPDHRRTPAGVRLKQRIYPYLLRSRKAADQFPACLQVRIKAILLNPLSLKSDQHQFSQNIINGQSVGKAMRIEKMITKEIML